jgi:hypothetical protein
MAENLEVDPAQFFHDGGSFIQVGDVAESIASGLENGVGLQGKWYGTDKFGNKIEESLIPGIKALGDAIRTTQTSMTNTGVSLTESGQGYVKVDQHNAESVPNPLPPRRTS